MKNKFLKTFILFSLLAAGASAQPGHKLLPAEQEIPLNYGADRLGKRYDADMQKFRDNRLGAFIHWGLYAMAQVMGKSSVGRVAGVDETVESDEV